jgi:hypothetical protein
MTVTLAGGDESFPTMGEIWRLLQRGYRHALDCAIKTRFLLRPLAVQSARAHRLQRRRQEAGMVRTLSLSLMLMLCSSSAFAHPAFAAEYNKYTPVTSSHPAAELRSTHPDSSSGADVKDSQTTVTPRSSRQRERPAPTSGRLPGPGTSLPLAALFGALALMGGAALAATRKDAQRN